MQAKRPFDGFFGSTISKIRIERVEGREQFVSLFGLSGHLDLAGLNRARKCNAA
jgi:hypothetical protein